MFKFSFFNSVENSENREKSTDDKNRENILWSQAEEIEINNLPLLKNILESNNEVETFKCEYCPPILHVSINIVIEIIKKNCINNSILNAEIDHSDLVPSVYEGGLKIWECTYDLVKYIFTKSIQLDKKHVLDLGCGVGIIGILSLLHSSYVYFQDYNREVLEYVTIPNVLLNLETKPENTLSTCKFYYGDWESFSEIMNNKNVKFDYIFTSETIYNLDNYKKLHMVFENCLSKNGVVYLSAKAHYFGVGGGLRSFEEYLTKEGIFNFEVCWKSTDGVQRDIIKISFKSS